MMYTYKYELVGGHLIAVTEQLRLLIDTGAPASVADCTSLAFAGRSFRAQRNYMGISPESLSGSVGTSINALVGADILNQYDVLIDPTSNTFNMTADELPLVGQSMELDNFMGRLRHGTHHYRVCRLGGHQGQQHHAGAVHYYRSCDFNHPGICGAL